MWPRHIELAIGVWLLLSPFIFRHGERTGLWATDLVCGTAVIVLSLLAHWGKAFRAHLLELPFALWMMGFGWWGARASALGGYQNEILAGFLLAMFAIIPGDASLPPPKWRRFLAERNRGGGAAIQDLDG